MTKGWISLHRQIMSHWLYPSNESRKFTRYEAWLDLLLFATHKEIETMVQGKLEKVQRGCFVSSELQLSLKWSWDRKTVKKFLAELKKYDMISCSKINTKNAKSCTMYKINNYEDFQDNSSQESPTKAPTKYPMESPLNNNDNNENKYIEKKFKKNSGGFLKYAR